MLFAAVALLAWSLIAWAAARALVVRAELARADALVVLAGSSAYRERAAHAAELWREGRAPKIILTDDKQQGGWSSVEQRNPFFVERAVAELAQRGVPSANIEVLPLKVSSTYEEAVLLREHATGRGLRTLLVVTSGYHSRRALWTLRRVFKGTSVEVGLSPVVMEEQTASPVAWWLRPRGWRAVAGEYLKMVYYRVRY